MIERPSPNHDERPEGTPIDMLVLHYTGMKTAAEALARLCDPQAKVSAHYTIDCDGTVFAHVPEDRRAWHAGVSYWAGARDINARSIGVELVNPGHEFGYEPFARAQIAALIDLGEEIVARHAIPQSRVLGHSDVAPARKEDPGELFPWSELAEFGIGLWPFADSELVAKVPRPSGEESAFLRDLARFGYGLAPEVDVTPRKAIAAFQRHWRPSSVDGVIDEETAYRLSLLLQALS